MRKKILTTGCAISLVLWVLFAAMPLLEAQAASAMQLSATPGLGVYSDSACTKALTLLDWGKVYPGDIVHQTIYVKNLGNNRLKLTLSAENWNPTTANEAFRVNWDTEASRIAPGQVVASNLTLTVSPNAAGFTTFGVDVTVKGTSYGRQG